VLDGTADALGWGSCVVRGARAGEWRLSPAARGGRHGLGHGMALPCDADSGLLGCLHSLHVACARRPSVRTWPGARYGGYVVRCLTCVLDGAAIPLRRWAEMRQVAGVWRLLKLLCAGIGTCAVVATDVLYLGGGSSLSGAHLCCVCVAPGCRLRH
jgi:hypothetical protein